MTEQCLTVGAGKVQLARREGDVAALRDGFGPDLAHRFVLIKLYILFQFNLIPI